MKMKIIYELKYMNASIYIGDVDSTGNDIKDVCADVKKKDMLAFERIEILAKVSEDELEFEKYKYLESHRPLINYNGSSVFDWFIYEMQNPNSYVFNQIERFKNKEFE